MKTMLRTTFLIGFTALTLCLGACNTTKGAGKDMESVGENIQHQAEKSGAH